jgi:hypothetical protein
MLEGVKIVIERLQMDDPNKGRWLDIADGIIKDPQQIFTEQERNEVRNIYRTAMRKQFNAHIIDELADRPKLEPEIRRPKTRMQASFPRDLQNEALKILNEEASKYK